MSQLRTISPVDGRVLVERPLADVADIEHALSTAARAQLLWRALTLAERSAACSALVDALVADAAAAATELTWQMGRPIAHSPGELVGFETRARRMIELAPEGLADVAVPSQPGVARRIARVRAVAGPPSERMRSPP